MKELLDDYLQEVLDERRDDRVWLAVPEIIEWAEAKFRFVLPNRNRLLFNDIEMQDLRDALGEELQLTVELLKTKKVELVDQQHNAVQRWRIYDCLNAEVGIGDDTFVLSNGSWYRVDPELSGEVDDLVRSIPRPEFSFPEFELDDKDEASYNLRVGRLFPERFCCLDGKNIPFGGGRNKFELCDILDRDGLFIHVKRYGGSAVLSHLFAQGFVSADLLMKRNGFRQSAASLVEQRGFTMAAGKELTRRGPRTAVYLIVVGRNHQRRVDLPLFSKINFQNAYRGLDALGWEVQLGLVQRSESISKMRGRKKT